jgi:hypothetical protein
LRSVNGNSRRSNSPRLHRRISRIKPIDVPIVGNDKMICLNTSSLKKLMEDRT